MAIDGISNGISGAIAASNRFAVSANNTANIVSRGIDPREQQAVRDDPAGQREVQGFQPQQAIDQNVASGGVRSTTRPIEPASIPVLQEDTARIQQDRAAQIENGTLQGNPGEAGLASNPVGQDVSFLPNVDPANEAVQQIVSQRQYEANLRTVQAGFQLTRSLLDIDS
ncbi:flagellar basal body rod C-terminal domain-containing protein [Oceanibaculum pacificum]|uniref:Flagellar basal-body/hook protein C-terminal domain-containing protein n=1 Tax=Oceanibaculum pacificum TaxID=580166 RepID=A0A154VXB7_9PROT|nr:flagellar basal body rod C-terminal domain-containing protein [Oceanibaculum pacificum]KZD05849.1 hypothetical protein AUP43_02760 [Oceanibaculum pacificum]